MRQLQDETLRASLLAHSSDPRVCFALKIFSAKISWKLDSKGKDPRAAAKHETHNQRHPPPTNDSTDASMKSDNMGKHNENQDLSTSLPLFLWSLSSFAIRYFGIQVLYLSSFSLKEPYRNSSLFQHSVLPQTCAATKSWFFSLYSPHNHHWNANTCCDFYQHVLLPQSSGSKTLRHAVPIKSNFSDKELARTGLIIRSGSWSFPSLRKVSELSRFREQLSPFHVSGTNQVTSKKRFAGCYLPN